MSRQTAYILAVFGAIVTVGGVIIALSHSGLDDKSTPVIISVVSILGGLVTQLVTASKAIESADSSAKAVNTAQETQTVVTYSVSQLAALQQLHEAHIECPLANCPMGLHRGVE